MFYVHIFSTKFWHQKLKAETFGFETFWRKDIGVKRVRKTLMKLTPYENVQKAVANVESFN